MEICFFNRKRLSWCQLELADNICQNGVCTQTKKSVFIIRPVSNMSQVYKYQTVWEILTLGKRNNMNKRYINVLLYGIYLSLVCLSGGTIDRIICLVCLYLSLYISFLLFGNLLIFFDTSTKDEIKKNVKLIKRKYIMTNTDTLETDYSV